MRGRHVPIRTCVACRTSGDKRGLLRVVRTPDGHVAYDPTGKANGRGSYVCASAACISLARKRGSLVRALKCQVPAETYLALDAAASLAHSQHAPSDS